MVISIECTRVTVTLNLNILGFFVSDKPLLRYQRGQRHSYFSKIYVCVKKVFEMNKNFVYVFPECIY